MDGGCAVAQNWEDGKQPKSKPNTQFNTGKQVTNKKHQRAENQESEKIIVVFAGGLIDEPYNWIGSQQVKAQSQDQFIEISIEKFDSE